MPETGATKESFPPQVKPFGRAVVILAVLFALPLFRLAVFAIKSDLHSYVLLIPVVSYYLACLEKKNLHRFSDPAIRAGLVFAGAGLGMTAWYWLAPAGPEADALARITAAFVLLVTAAGFMILGGGLMRQLAFPFGLLIFMIPMPDFLRDSVETGLQHGSAMVAGWFFAVSDLPVLQDGLAFKLPGITLLVAQECSGIHSTVVLFITSLVAGKLFLQQPWKRAVLCLAVIPLALARNAFRILVLGELCVHIGPRMIDSQIHRHGGPIFFALSMIPFLLLLYILRRHWQPDPGASKI